MTSLAIAGETAPGASPWDLPNAHRPTLLDFNGGKPQNDPNPDNAPVPGEHVTAAQMATEAALTVSIGRMVPNARLAVAGGASPSVLYVACAGNTFTPANFVLTRNGAGDVSVTYAEPSGTTTWAGVTAYSTGAFVRPSIATGLYYKASAGGTSAASPPMWPLVVGATVTDGSVTWTCFGLITPWPTVVSQPSAKLNLPAGLDGTNAASISAVLIANGARVTTALGGVLTDLNFTVSLR